MAGFLLVSLRKKTLCIFIASISEPKSELKAQRKTSAGTVPIVLAWLNSAPKKTPICRGSPSPPFIEVRLSDPQILGFFA